MVQRFIHQHLEPRGAFLDSRVVPP
jgi:hypothetical protein